MTTKLSCSLNQHLIKGIRPSAESKQTTLMYSTNSRRKATMRRSWLPMREEYHPHSNLLQGRTKTTKLN